MQPRPRTRGGRPAGWLRSYRSIRFPAVTVAVILVVVVVAAVAVPSTQDWVRSWWGSATLTLIMLVGYGAAVGALGARHTVNAQTRFGRGLPAVVALAPLPFALLVGDPLQNGSLVAGSAAWGAIVLSLLALRATSAPTVPWPMRAAALGMPSWLLAVVGGLYLAASGSPQSVSNWLFPVQLGVVICGVVVVPAILVVESVSALGGEGWIGRWLAPETESRAWVALVAKGTATTVLILILTSQGIALTGWLQATIVALLVLILLALGQFVPLDDLRRGPGLEGRLRVSITVAMGALGVLFGGYVLLLAFRRPLTLLGLAFVSWVAMFMPAPPGGRVGRIISVTIAGALAAWAWAAGPTIGRPLTVDVFVYAVPAIIVLFLGAVLIQVIRALKARQWGFPVVVLATAAGALAAFLTGQSAEVAPMNLLVLPVLALTMLFGRSFRKHLIGAGAVIRWSVLSLIGIDLLAAASLATGLAQAVVLAVTFVTLGFAPLVLNGRGGPRIRAAGLVCGIFTALVATLSVGVHLESPTSLLEMLHSLTREFFWVIAFPVSAALSATSARLEPDGSPSPAE